MHTLFVILPEKLPRQFIFHAMVELFEEQKGTDEESKTVGLRQIINDPSLVKISSYDHISEFTNVVKNYLELPSIIRDANNKEKEVGWCEKIKDYEVYQSFIDFGPLKFQLPIDKMLNITDLESLKEA